VEEETFDVNSELTDVPADPLSELDEVIHDLERAIDNVIRGPTPMNCKAVEEANKVETFDVNSELTRSELDEELPVTFCAVRVLVLNLSSYRVPP
jgi:hypothetical protein